MVITFDSVGGYRYEEVLGWNSDGQHTGSRMGREEGQLERIEALRLGCLIFAIFARQQNIGG